MREECGGGEAEWEDDVGSEEDGAGGEDMGLDAACRLVTSDRLAKPGGEGGEDGGLEGVDVGGAWEDELVDGRWVAHEG